MKNIKEILTNALYGMLRSYDGKRFVPSLIVKLVMSLAAAVITAFFANTLFSHNSTANQIFAALSFYFLITAVSNLITEIKRGVFGKRLKTALGNMVRLKPPALWFFIAAIVISLFLPYAFVLSLSFLLFVSAVSRENSMLLGIKNAVTKGKNPQRNGKGLAAFTSGLIVCGLIVCILANIGIPTPYGLIDGSNPKNDTSQTEQVDKDNTSAPDTPSATGDTDSKQDSKDVIVSGDTEIREAAQTLTDKLIEYAGKDKKSFEKLFRNTDSSAIDQYYNTSYDDFKKYKNSLIAIAAENGDSVWFTALYYQIPKKYPSEKEKSVYLSTIMTRGSDGCKIEWNDDVRSRLQSDYDNAGFSYQGLEAKEQGYAWAKFFIPFDLICPNGKALNYAYDSHSKTASGYTVTQKNYVCESCSGCPHRDKCFKGQYENRKIRISQTMAKQKEKAERLMFSDDCIILLMNRSIQVGDALGVLKEYYAFRRFLTGGKSKTEIQFYCSALPLRFKSIATD